jgi:hypothetical protein
MQVDSAHDFSWKSKSAPRYKFRQVTAETSSAAVFAPSAQSTVTFRFGRSWVLNLAKSRLQFIMTVPVQTTTTVSNVHCLAPILASYSLQTESGVMLQQVDTYAQGIYKALMPTCIQSEDFKNYPGLIVGTTDPLITEPLSGMIPSNVAGVANYQIDETGAAVVPAADYIQQRALIQSTAAKEVRMIVDCAFDDLFPPCALNVPVDHYPGMDYVLSLSFAGTSKFAFSSTNAALSGKTGLTVEWTTFTSNPVIQVACLDDMTQAQAIKELCLTQGVQVPCPRIFMDNQSFNGSATKFTRQYKFNISHGSRLLRVAAIAYPTNATYFCYNTFNVPAIADPYAPVQWTTFRDFLGQIPLSDQDLTPAEVHAQLIRPLFEKTLHGKKQIWDQNSAIVRDFTGGWDLRKGCPAAGVDLQLPIDYEIQLGTSAVPTNVLCVWLGQNVFRVGPQGPSLMPA